MSVNRCNIPAQTGHKSDAVVQRYIPNSQLFSNHPTFTHGGLM